MSLYAGRDALANLYPTKGDECHSCPTMVAECGHIDSSDTASSPTLLSFYSSHNLYYTLQYRAAHYYLGRIQDPPPPLLLGTPKVHKEGNKTSRVYVHMQHILVVKRTQYAAQWSYKSFFFKMNEWLKSIPRV